jgi:hypothetical protein
MNAVNFAFHFMDVTIAVICCKIISDMVVDALFGHDHA